MTTKSAKAAESKPVHHRRIPSQRRARVTVDSIVEAAQRLLAEQGPQALSTRRIAERAGVSIGSLYQYFPNRESIVARLFEPILQSAAQRGAQRYQLPLGTEEFFIEAYRGQIALTKQLVDLDGATYAKHQKYLMWDWFTERLGMSPQRRRENIEQFLRDRRPELTRPELDLSSHILAIAVPSMIDSLALEQPALLHERSLLVKLADIVRCALDSRPHRPE